MSCMSVFDDGSTCLDEATRHIEIVLSPGNIVDLHLCDDCGDAVMAEDGPIQIREAA